MKVCNEIYIKNYTEENTLSVVVMLAFRYEPMTHRNNCFENTNELNKKAFVRYGSKHTKVKIVSFM